MSPESRLKYFHGITAGLTNECIDDWIRSNKKVIGYFCSYVPVELLTAAGILPLRLRGTGSQDSATADALLSSRICTYVRHTMSLALDGKYEFLEGVICLNTCDHVRRAFDIWRHKTNVKFQGFISLPRNARESLYPYFREEIENLKSEIMKHFSCRIGEPELRSAITLHNQVRDRLARIEEYRARTVLSGADMLAVSVASQILAPKVFLEQADALLSELQAGEPRESRARLLLAGTELDEPEFVAAVESQGAAVVSDSLCYGARTHRSPVDESAADLMDALCRRYFFQVSCARMIGNFPDRLDDLLATVKEREIDGVVFQRLKFCDPWGGEAHNLRRRLKEQGIPLLVLEREYGLVNPGQVKTRVQAFLELIESGSRRRKDPQVPAESREVSP